MSTSESILTLADHGDASTLREVLRDRALRSLYFFNKALAGYTKLTDYLHKPFCDHIQTTAQDVRKRVYLWPRGYYKSSIAKGYALWCHLPCPEVDYLGNPYPDYLRWLHDPDGPILFVGESELVASSKLRDIKANVESNQLIQWLFPEILPKRDGKWTETEITLGARTKSQDESSIMAIGIGGKITGFHFKKIIYDDPIGEKAAESEAEMDKAWSWFEVAPGLLQDPATGEEAGFGTRWKHGTADIWGRMKALLPAEVEETGRHTGFTFFERSVIEDNQPTFPDKYPLPIIKELEKRLGSYRFGCNYMNNPTLPEGADFKPEWIKEYGIEKDSEGKMNRILPRDGTPSFSLGKLLRMSFYDVSAGGKSAGAENAIIVAGMDSLRRIFVLSSWSANCTIGEAIEEWHKKNDRFRCYHNHFEDVGAQKVVLDLVKERNLGQQGTKGPLCRTCGDSHYRLEPLAVKPVGGKNKEERVRMFAQESFQQGRVYLYEGMLKLKGQILSFPHGDLVDQFDALAYLCNLLRPPLSDEEVLDMEEEEEKHKRPAMARILTGGRVYGGYV